MTHSLSMAWEALGWLRDMGWYKDMLHASWFRPILPYWTKYHLVWIVLGLLALLLLLVLKEIFGRKVNVTRGPARAKKQRKLAMKAAGHYLQAGEKMMAADAFLAAAKPDRALELLVEMKSWSRAGSLAEQMGKVDDAVEYFGKANDTESVVRILQKAGRIEQAAGEYEKQDRLVDAAKLYLEVGRLESAAKLYERVGMHGKAAELFLEEGKKDRAIECLQTLVSQASAGFTDDECGLLVQGAAILFDENKVEQSARMLEAAGQFEGAASRYEICGARNEAAKCYEKLGRIRKAADMTDDPQTRLSILERLRREGQRVEDLRFAKALHDAGRYEDAMELFLKMGDSEAAIKACLESGNTSDAAKILSDQGKNLESARMFVEAGDMESAREQYLLAGDKLSAAKAAGRMGLFLKAGEEFFSIGRYEDAVVNLQKVDVSDPDHRKALSILGKAFASMGDKQMALRMHKKAIANLALRKDNLELFYNMARFMESVAGNEAIDQAREIYGGILEVDYGFADVKERMKRLG